MPKTKFLGHPLHPQLITLPAGLLPFSFVMDLMHFGTQRRAYAEAAYFTMIGGTLGGLAAGIAGAADYLQIPSRTSTRHTKRIANVHALMNVGALLLYGINLLLRRHARTVGRAPAGKVPIAMSAIGTVGLLISAWYGAHLVYEHGVRVKGTDPLAQAPRVKPPGGEKVATALEKAAESMPAAGPTLDER